MAKDLNQQPQGGFEPPPPEPEAPDPSIAENREYSEGSVHRRA